MKINRVQVRNFKFITVCNFVKMEKIFTNYSINNYIKITSNSMLKLEFLKCAITLCLCCSFLIQLTVPHVIIYCIVTHVQHRLSNDETKPQKYRIRQVFLEIKQNRNAL